MSGDIKRFLSGSVAIVRKDLAMELRGKEIFTTTFMFAVLTLLIFNFAFDMTSIKVEDAAAGVLWVAFLFSGSITMNRSFLHEKEDGCLSALMLAPISRSGVYFGKMASNLILTLLTMAVIIPIFTVMYNINVMERFFLQSLTLFLGAVGFNSVGLLVAAMAVNLRAREMMGPLLLLPVVTPVVIAAVKASGGLIRGESVEQLWVWFQILAVFDVIYLVAPWLLFEHIIEE
ncbi:MAG: heme exporter protein CcmB [Nitrospinae bacterium]|nr:heme exporter protein CcmB [Nitrospinota bacterium]